MNPNMGPLRALALLDATIRELAERRSAAEEAVASAELALSEAEAHLTGRGEEIRNLQKEADALNLEVRAAEEEIAKHDEHLRTAKSNKEYDVLRRELEAAKAKKSDLEDQVLGKLERADVVAEEEADAKARLASARGSLETEREKAGRVEAEISERDVRLRGEREEVVSKLEAETRRLYERLLEQRGDAMARVADGVCSSCARKLTPQMDNLLAVGEEIVQCMSCRRILYRDDGEGAS